MTPTILTLCVIREPHRVLLGMKKRGFGAGRWNGFGGKLEPGETIEAAMQREVREEAGVSIENPEKAGILRFEFQGSPEHLEMHIFKAEKFDGEPREGDEMRPQWFGIDEIPFSEMWPDDIYWMPLFLENKKFKGKFLFDARGGSVLKYSLELVPSF